MADLSADVQVLAEVVAAVAFDHCGLVALVALRAVDLPQVRVVRIDVELVGLLGHLRVGAVAGEALLLRDRPGVAARVAGLALRAPRDVAVGEHLAIGGQRLASGKSHCRSKTKSGDEFHFVRPAAHVCLVVKVHRPPDRGKD